MDRQCPALLILHNFQHGWVYGPIPPTFPDIILNSDRLWMNASDPLHVDLQQTRRVSPPIPPTRKIILPRPGNSGFTREREIFPRADVIKPLFYANGLIDSGVPSTSSTPLAASSCVRFPFTSRVSARTENGDGEPSGAGLSKASMACRPWAPVAPTTRMILFVDIFIAAASSSEVGGIFFFY